MQLLKYVDLQDRSKLNYKLTGTHIIQSIMLLYIYTYLY